MAYVMSMRGAGAGSTPAQTLNWALDAVEEGDPFASGYAIPLSQTPVDADAILVYSEGLVLFPTDWQYNAGTNEVEILFSADPASDTADGVWHFFVQYPYA